MPVQIYYQNVRGLRTKTNSVYCESLQSDFEIICLTETYLNGSVFDGEIFCDDYQVFRRDRESTGSTKRDGGGVLVATKRTMDAVLLPDVCTEAEDLWISVSHCNNRLLLCCVYLPPDDFDALEYFMYGLVSVCEKYPDSVIIICGDFNVPLLKWSASADGSLCPSASYDKRSRMFLDTFSYCNLFQFNNVENTKSRLLDLVISNNSGIIDVCPCPGSLVEEDNHHPSLIVNLSRINIAPLRRAGVRKYLFNCANYEDITMSLKNIDWDDLLADLGTDEAVDVFYKKIWQVIDKHVPYKTPRVQRYPSWFSEATIKCIKEKRKFHKKWKVYCNKIDYLTFALLRARSKRLICSDYRVYVASVEESISVGPGRVWSFVGCRRRSASRIPDTVRHDAVVASDGKAICELFNNYFHSVFVDGRAEEGALGAGTRCFVPLFTHEQIRDQLRALVPSIGSGPDGIPGLFLRNCSDELVRPLYHIFSHSLREANFPAAWKRAYVTPIFKSGNKQLVQNYRPISILSNISKVFESLIYKVILHDVKNKIIPQQHGFFPGRSVETNLCTYTEYILKSLDSRTQVDAIYTDFSKAFDKIDHAILINKLRLVGLDEFLVLLLHSYVTGRSQAVRLNNFVSSFKKIPSGVAQGSHIGPLVFSIYVSDISSCFLYSEFLMYADDTKIYSSISSLQDCVNFQSDLDRFHEYCLTNKLVLNYNKCQKITFTRSRYPFDTDYSLGRNILSAVSSIRDLGVIVDSKLMFDAHIKYCTQRAYRALGFIIRTSSSFSSLSTINALYNAYVNSILSFASVVWNPQYQIYIDQLESIQKRYVNYLSRKYHLPACTYERRCIVFGLVPLWKRRCVHDGVFLYKILNAIHDAPDLLHSIMFNVPSHFGRSSCFLRQSLCHTNSLQNSPINRLITSYNRYYCHVDPFHTSLITFKRKLQELSTRL